MSLVPSTLAHTAYSKNTVESCSKHTCTQSLLQAYCSQYNDPCPSSCSITGIESYMLLLGACNFGALAWGVIYALDWGMIAVAWLVSRQTCPDMEDVILMDAYTSQENAD